MVQQWPQPNKKFFMTMGVYCAPCARCAQTLFKAIPKVGR